MDGKWKGKGRFASPSIAIHLLFSKGDAQKLLMQNMNNLLFLYTEIHLFQEGYIR